MSDEEADRIIGGIIRRWVTTEPRRLYFSWSDTELTLDAGIDITPEEYEALSTIGTGREWWNDKGYE